MTPDLPLQNKLVMVPRGKGHAKSFSDLVVKYGGIPVEIPLIAFKPVAATEELQNILKRLHTYDWIIFTSNVTVETFYSFFSEPVNLPKIAVIGEKTRQVLEKKGEKVRFTPGCYVAEGFIEDFAPLVKEGERILIPKGNLAREYIAASLKKIGAAVDELVIYETYLPEESRAKLIQMLTNRSLDILTFTSPSTIDHFMGIVQQNGLQPRIEDSIVACIGPVSKQKAEEWGLTVHAVPEKYTVEDMLKSIIEYLRKVS
ncbi:uroporphyrinogen-III synthase [Bacillus sp. REN3]|uniref:uroporphyrinogen-III synthase n=1 Tax=Bacillus sp. REN3 TaxID=2802440 RepID=UPI001AEDC62B|nr:uroporphyrinogen-III synthase [Bacillus sp. REN3]